MSLKQDLGALEAFIRNAAHQPTKHHEVSQALQALERVSRLPAAPLDAFTSAYETAHAEAKAKGLDPTTCDLLGTIAVSSAALDRMRVLMQARGTQRK